jgi:hypothetical protein
MSWVGLTGLLVRDGRGSIPSLVSGGEQRTRCSLTWQSLVLSSILKLIVGISYTIIAPLIMLFLVITFSLFYFTYLHNFLYVYEFTVDTGGLSFPRALFQTMTGIYFAEICLIGLFLVSPGARAQGIVMIVVLVLTMIFQYQLSSSFDPLITYLPIDVQDEVYPEVQEQKVAEGHHPDEEARYSQQRIVQPKGIGDAVVPAVTAKSDPADTRGVGDDIPAMPDPAHTDIHAAKSPRRVLPSLTPNSKSPLKKLGKKKLDEISEDEELDITLQRKLRHELTMEEMTQIAFSHEALRARPPVIWIPEDELGIARDEIYHTKLESDDGIAISSEGAKLNDKFKIEWTANPPDYIYIDTI